MTPVPNFTVAEELDAHGVAVVAAAGEIDMFTAPEFKSAIARAIDQGAWAVVVDLSETRFLDSTALGVLIGTVKRLRGVDGRMVVVNTEPSTERTFRLTGLDRIFEIFPDRAAAREALAG